MGDEESNDGGTSGEAAPGGVLAAVSGYLGSWVGMTPVPEGDALVYHCPDIYDTAASICCIVVVLASVSSMDNRSAVFTSDTGIDTRTIETNWNKLSPVASEKQKLGWSSHRTNGVCHDMGSVMFA